MARLFVLKGPAAHRPAHCGAASAAALVAGHRGLAVPSNRGSSSTLAIEAISSDMGACALCAVGPLSIVGCDGLVAVDHMT